jgi:hypothetical protein
MGADTYLNSYKIIDELLFEWEGVDISLNKFYSSPHWTIRSKEKVFWTNLFSKIPIKNNRQINEYQLTLRYNSRLDADNTILHCKFLIDYLRSTNLIIDDNKKYYKGLHIIPDESLGKKHYKLYVQIISYATKETKAYRA